MKFTKARNSSVCYSQFQAEGRGISCGQLRKFTIFYLSLPRKAAMSILRPQFPRLHTEKFKYWQSQKWLKEINTLLYFQSAASLPTWAVFHPISLRLTQGWVWGQQAQCLSCTEDRDLALSRRSRLRTRHQEAGEERGEGSSHIHLPGGHQAVPALRGPPEREHAATWCSFPEPLKLQEES